MYHCTHCHKTMDNKIGWYEDGIGGSYCQNCIFLAIELLDQDPPNAKEPVETAITNNRCAICHKFLRSDEQWQIVDGGMFAHKDCFAPPPVEVGHGEASPDGYEQTPVWKMQGYGADPTSNAPLNYRFDFSGRTADYPVYISPVLAPAKCAVCGADAMSIHYDENHVQTFYCAAHSPLFKSE